MPIQVSGSQVVDKAVPLSTPLGLANKNTVDETSIGETQETFRYWSKWLLMLAIVWSGLFYFGFDQPTTVLRDNWILFFVGILGAIIGNITAIGGGLVFVPFTLLVYGLDAVTSLKLAVACQAFGMTSGALAWWSRDRVPKRAFFSILPAIMIGCLIGGLAIRVDAALVKGLFGPVSCAIGICTLVLLYFPVKTTRVRVTPGLHITAVLGSTLTAWVAIGIGEAIAAFLMIRERVCAERAIALGVSALAASSIILFIIFSLIGPMPWEQISIMALGCIFGGRVAPLLSRYLPQHGIKLFFAIIALGDGALFIYNYYF